LKALLGVARAIDALNEQIGRFTAWIVLATVLLSAFGAIVRYGDKYVGTSLSRNEYNEGQWYLYAIGFLLMGAYTLKNAGHVRVDILSQRFPKKVQLWIEAIFSLLFVFFVYAVVAYLSWDFVLRSFATFQETPNSDGVSGWIIKLENSSDAGGLPRWIIKPFLLFGLILMSLQGLSEGLKALGKLFIKDNDQDDSSDALKGAV
jgi:TRAP-type mannitol/chloroaromatic compound transport system permease small subunit